MRRLGGRFVLEREIGAGGMSVVFLGRDEVLDRPVAIKVLRGGFVEDSEIGDRFRREGRTAARLSHPNIVQVYDAGEDELDGREVSYIVMEYVSGGDLKSLIDEKGPLTERGLARIGADVASGLAHAHGKRIVHRDIKPQNILIDSYGNSKLTDFGVVRALDATQATQTGSYLGTASYSSPEQLRGEGVTPKSDVYSLGITLYEAAVGEPPFSGNPIEVANQQLTKSPTPLQTRGAAIGELFETLILSCLAKDPAGRPDATGLQERMLRASAAASGIAASAAGADETTTTTNLAEAARGFAGAAGAMGAKGFDTVVRGMRDPAGPAGLPERTLATSQRTFRPGSRRAKLAAGAALLLLALIVVGASALLGPSVGEEADRQQDVVEPPSETKTGETTAAPAASEPAPPLEAAEQAVFDMYVTASYQDPSAVWPYFSRRFQGEAGSPERWAEQERLSTLWYVYFTRYPEAEVSGDTPKVRFQVRESRTGGPRLVTGTWVCVDEGGEWKLDRLEDENT